MNPFLSWLRALSVGSCLLICGSPSAWAAMHEFYVGVDGLPTFTSGTYSGLANPNAGRLTLLFAHWNDDNPSSNHYHGIGAYSYTGEPPAEAVIPTNGNNRIPETFTGQMPLTLQPGAGLYAGKWVSGPNGEHYSDIALHSVHELAGFGPTDPETSMYDSSSGRWNGSLAGLDLELELVSISSGLHLGTTTDPNATMLPGDRIPIGDLGSETFAPVFWADGTAPIGTYSAELRLHDTSGTFAQSGTFHFDFAQSVPEPGAMSLATVSILGLVAVKLGRRRLVTRVARAIA